MEKGKKISPGERVLMKCICVSCMAVFLFFGVIAWILGYLPEEDSNGPD